MRKIGLAIVVVIAVAGVEAVAVSASSNPACTTHGLRIRQDSSQAAAGTRLTALSYQNITSSTCRIVGFPGATLYGSGGRKLAIAERVRSRHGHPLEIRPDRQVYGVISYGQTPVPESRRCSAVTSVRIYAPNSRQSSRIALHQAGAYCHLAQAYPLAISARKSLDG